jgi:hypothetical protein
MIEFFQENIPIIVVFAVIFMAWLVLRTKGTKLDSDDHFTTRIGSGKPVLLKFFRNT